MREAAAVSVPRPLNARIAKWFSGDDAEWLDCSVLVSKDFPGAPVVGSVDVVFTAEASGESAGLSALPSSTSSDFAGAPSANECLVEMEEGHVTSTSSVFYECTRNECLERFTEQKFLDKHIRLKHSKVFDIRYCPFSHIYVLPEKIIFSELSIHQPFDLCRLF